MAASYNGAGWINEEPDWSENYNNSNTSTSNDCELYHTPKYRNIAMISGSTGLFSTIAAVAVILVIIILKKYNFFVQRLILYLCIASALNSASIVLRFSRAAYRSHDNQNIKSLCIAAAFIDQTTLWSVSIAYVCLTFNLLLTVVFKSSAQSIEIGYIVAIFLFPLMFNWIPFIQNSYGEAGAWCWIRGKDADYSNMANSTIINCSTHEFGVYLRYVLWYVPHYAIFCVLLVAYIVVVAKLIHNTTRWKGLYSMESIHQKERMKELVKPIIFYPLVYFFLDLFPLINRVYDTIHGPNYILWLLHAVFSPLQGGFIAVLYALDRDTMHRLSLRELLSYVFHRKTPIQEYPAKRGVTDSFETLLPNECTEDVTVEFNKEVRYGSIKVTPNNKDSQDVSEKDEKF